LCRSPISFSCFFAPAFAKILQPPLNGRQLFGVGNAKKLPGRLALLEGKHKPAVFLRHLADNLRDELLARLQQIVERDSFSVMPSKPRANSCEMSSRGGESTSTIGRFWLRMSR